MSNGCQPPRDGRPTGTALPHQAAFQPPPRRGIQRAPPRGLRDGDAPVRRALPGPGKHALVPASPPHPAVVSSGAPSAGQGGSVGCRGGSSTTATGGYWTSWSSASCVMGRCGETDGTLRSRLRRRSGGRNGLRGWNPTKAPQAYLAFPRSPYTGSSVSENNQYRKPSFREARLYTSSQRIRPTAITILTKAAWLVRP